MVPRSKNNEQRAEIRLALISSSRPWPTMIPVESEISQASNIPNVESIESFKSSSEHSRWTSEFKAMFELF